MLQSTRLVIRFCGYMDSNKPLEAVNLVLGRARKGKSNEALLQHPVFGDEIRDYLAESLKTWIAHRRGRVYVMANPVNPQVHKIGFTRKAVARRKKGLQQAGVFGPLHAIFELETEDAPSTEKTAHRLLRGVRSFNEFFEIPWADAIAIVQKADQLENEMRKRLLDGCP